MPDIASQIGTLTAAKLPLAAGLDAYGREAPSLRMRSALRRLSRAVAEGAALDEALGSVAEMPGYLRGLVAAGMESGRLSDVIERHLACLQRTRAIRVRVWMALFYPLTLYVIANVILFVLLVWPVPMLKGFYRDFGIELPAITLWVLEASDAALFVLDHWPVALGVLVGIIAVVVGIRFLPGRAARVRVWQWIPLLGTASRHAGLSEFCSLLSVLIECRLPLPSALRLTSGVLHDPNCAQGALRLADAVESGGSAEDELRRLPNFPNTLASLFRWSSRHHALAQGLNAAGELFAVQARVESGVFGIVVQPLILLTLAGASIATAVALLWPLYTMLSWLA